MAVAGILDPKRGMILTPEQIERRRRIADALIEASSQPQRIQQWTQGAAQVMQAIRGVVEQRRADKAEKENTAWNGAKADYWFGGSDFPAAPSAGTGAALPTSDAGQQIGLTSPAPSSSPAATPEVAELEGYIRDAAAKRGIDPDIAVRVARSEGLGPGVWQSNYMRNGKRETSYGPFQLLVGGGLGDKFQKIYGKSPADPSTVRQQIDFALDEAATGGWSPWYGAAKVGVGNRTGLANARALGYQPQAQNEVASLDPAAGMPPAAAAIEAQAPRAPAPYRDPMIVQSPQATALAAQDRQAPTPPAARPAAPPLPAPVNISTPPAQPVDEGQLYAQAIRARGGNPQAGILPVITGEPGQTGMATTGPNMQAIMRDLADPRLSEGNRRIADVLIRQEIEKQQAVQQEQAWRARKAYEMELQRNDPAAQLDMRYKQAQLDALTGKKQKNWQKLSDTMLFDPESGETKTIGNPTGVFRFSGNSVEAQALNGLIDSKQLTPEQAQQLAAGKQITNPADGSIIFMTPQGIFGQPANGGPAQQISAPQNGGGIDIFSGSQPAQTPAAKQPVTPQPSTPPGAIQLTPGKAQMPTEATRNRAANVDQAFSTITGELDRYAQLVKDHGIEVAPGEARDNMNSVRQGIMLQLKELFNLGVLNGPDLGLMERMIYDPVVDVTKEGGITNLPSQIWDATTGAAEGRANNSVAELKRMLGNIKQSVDGSLAGQRSGGQSAPGGWQDVDGVKIRRK